MLLIFMLEVTGYLILKAEKVRMCKGYLYYSAFHLMLFMPDIYRYVPIHISNISGNISYFKLIGDLNTDSVILRTIFVIQ